MTNSDVDEREFQMIVRFLTAKGLITETTDIFGQVVRIIDSYEKEIVELKNTINSLSPPF